MNRLPITPCRFVVLSIIAFIGLTISSAQAPAADAPKVKVETLATDLAGPCGVALQPSTQDIFVCDTGAGSVLRFSREKPQQKPTAIVTGFPTAVGDDKPATARIGPLGIAFLNEHNFAVGAALKSGEPTLQVYSLPADDSADGKPIDFDDAKQKLGSTADDKDAITLEGKFYGLSLSAFNPPSLLFTNPGSSRGWIFKADVKNWSSLNALKPFIFIPPKAIAQTGITSGGIAINRRGLLVVATGAAEQTKGSWLAFYNNTPSDPNKLGALIGTFATPLHDIVGLAYSPDNGRLYAADLAWSKPGDGGIYRLDMVQVDGRAGVKPVKIAAVERPTALAFSSDNSLYVTALGAAEQKPKEREAKSNEGELPKTGQLLKIIGDL